jgi:hypothetical protein
MAIRRPGCGGLSTCNVKGRSAASMREGTVPQAAATFWKALRDITLLCTGHLLSCDDAVLCRYQAKELWLGLKNPLERHGVDVACVVHEWRDRFVRQSPCSLCWYSIACLTYVSLKLCKGKSVHISCRCREIQQFGSFWPGPVYHDKDMAFFKVMTV